MDGWIKIYRKLKDWEWYTDSNVVHLFIHLLLSANFTETRRKGIVYNAGQVVTSIVMLAAELDKSYPTILRCLKILSESGVINVKSTNKKTIITICKYKQYQQDSTSCYKNNLDQTLEQPLEQSLDQTLEQPLELIYNKNIKKEKNVKNVGNIIADNENFESAENENQNNGTINEKKEKERKHKYGQFNNVLLTDKEAEKLHTEYGDSAVGIVEYLSAYKVEKDYKTKSDYLTIKRWVADAYNKQTKTNSNGNTNNQISMQRIFEASEAMREYEQQLFGR
jgi:DNA-binding transcriptional regulator YhcF (GntR family)